MKKDLTRIGLSQMAKARDEKESPSWVMADLKLGKMIVYIEYQKICDFQILTT